MLTILSRPPRHAHARVPWLWWVCGFAALQGVFYLRFTMGYSVGVSWRVATIAIAVFMALSYVPIFVRRRRLRARLRASDGALCPDCGYDLRALDSPTPCPECGRTWNREADTAWWRKWVDF
jgi:hypothetical protein